MEKSTREEISRQLSTVPDESDSEELFVVELKQRWVEPELITYDSPQAKAGTPRWSNTS